jgi:hypothetical protein
VRLCVRDPEKSVQENLEIAANVPTIRSGEWTGILVSYDGREVVVATDDGYGPVVRARQPETRPLAVDAEKELIFGAGLDGWIDDCRFGGVRAADPVRLPDGLRVAEAKRIRFVNGRLDTATHPGAERLSLRSGTKLTTFEIGPSGTVLAVVETEVPADAPPENGGRPKPPGGGGK